MKRVEDSRTQQVRVMRYQYLNGNRRLFGGALMQWIDELAGTVAMRHSGGSVITAAVDTLVFKEPAYLDDLVVMEGRITYVGRTSMEVRVDSFAEKTTGERRMINRAYLVMVAVDGDARPRPVPPLELATDEDRREWSAGEKRNALRKARREENY